MTDEHMSDYLAALQDLETRLSADEAAMKELATQPTGGQADGGLSSSPMHLADMGTETFMQEIDATILQTEQFLVTEVRAALKRLKDNNFGTCEGCREPIRPERLEAIPYTRYCTPCSEVSDTSPKANVDAGRPRQWGGSLDQLDSTQRIDFTGAASEGTFDPETSDTTTAYAGLTGGAIGGTPAGKRVTGGRTASSDGD